MEIRYGTRENSVLIPSDNLKLIPADDFKRFELFGVDPVPFTKKSVYINDIEINESSVVVIRENNYYLFPDLKIYYGTDSKNIEVTQLVYEKLFENGTLVIPTNDHIRCGILGDPLVGTLKFIYIHILIFFIFKLEYQVFLKYYLN